MERRTHLVLVGLMASVVAFSATPARAAYQRYSAVGCLNLNANSLTYLDPSVIPSLTAGMINFDDYDGVSLFCEVDDDANFPKYSVNTLNVHVHDGSAVGSVYAWACVTTYPSNGYACGNDDYTPYSNTGDYVLHPDLSIWQNSNYSGDFPFVLVGLPAHQPSSASNLRGFYTAS